MYIAGLHHSVLINIAIVIAVILGTYWLREGSALLGLAFLQPTPTGVLPRGDVEGTQTDAVADGYSGSNIGFHDPG